MERNRVKKRNSFKIKKTHLKMYNFRKLNFWESDSANLINGTDGTFYPPFLNRQKRLYSFNPDMCR